MRQIRKIIFHCTDSDHEHHDNYESIYKWHVEENGWSDIGYQYIILKSGAVLNARPINKAGAHCHGQNDDSIGICLTGKNDFSEEQFSAARDIARELCHAYGLMNAQIFGHRDFNKGKTCPNFNIEKVLPF